MKVILIVFSAAMGWAVCAQVQVAPNQASLRDRVAAIRYPPLERQARIQGDVHAVWRQGLITAPEAHKLLAQSTVRIWAALGVETPDGTEILFHYAFDREPEFRHTSTVVHRSNFIGRSLLRLFLMPTSKVVTKDECIDLPPPPTSARFDQRGIPVEIWVHSASICLQTIADGVQPIRAR
jgi:hypothetical protein